MTEFIRQVAFTACRPAHAHQWWQSGVCGYKLSAASSRGLDPAEAFVAEHLSACGGWRS